KVRETTMSLSRLEELVKPYILDYLDPTGDIRKRPKQIDVQCSSDSLIISRVYTHNKALTFYSNDKDRFYKFINFAGFRPDICLNKNYRTITRNDNDHDWYHKTVNDFSPTHIHLLKEKTNHKEMSTDEVICLIDHIKKYEKQNNECLDGKNNCIL